MGYFNTNLGIPLDAILDLRKAWRPKWSFSLCAAGRSCLQEVRWLLWSPLHVVEQLRAPVDRSHRSREVLQPAGKWGEIIPDDGWFFIEVAGKSMELTAGSCIYTRLYKFHRTKCWIFHCQLFDDWRATVFFLPLVGLNTWRMDHFGGWYILNMLIPPDFIGQYVPTHRNPVLNPY